MALRHRLTKDEHAALAEPLREHYKESDGAYVLDGFAPSDTLREFRDTNTRLQSELRGIKDKYGDLDPEKARAALAEVEKRKEPPKDDDIEKRIRDAVEAATKPLHTRLGSMESERNDLKAKNQRQTFETVVNDAATKAGVQGDYLIDVRSRAQSFGFKVVGDSAVRALGGEKGDEPITNDDGKEVTLPDFLKTLPGAFYGRTQGSGPGREEMGPGQT